MNGAKAEQLKKPATRSTGSVPGIAFSNVIRNCPLNILAIEPYYGGSHRDFLDRAVRLSAHRWTLATAPARHWKWRMRSSPLTLAAACANIANQSDQDDQSKWFDVIVCSDMLDLPAWLGLMSRDRTASTQRLLTLPIATYFHESQWDYPLSEGERIDHHFGYTNLLSAAASDVCWFNSQFHRGVFVASCKQFIGRMPDERELHDLDAIESKSAVIPPGFQSTFVQRQRQQCESIRIGWVARWEHDKRPDVFVQLLDHLKAKGIAFQLVLLGARRGDEPALIEIEKRFSDRILLNEYADSRDRYVQSLGLIDVVVSTSDHEFFGIGVCEAIDAGAAPVLPNRLSYPELIPGQECYDNIDSAVEMIARLTDSNTRQQAAEMARRSIQKFYSEPCIAQLDGAIEQLLEPK